MNLRSIVRGGIGVVHPDTQIQWLKYLSATPPGGDASGLMTPTYAPACNVWAQIQPIPTDRLAHLENLNIQGVLRSVYMRGAVASAVREDGTGGDLLLFPELACGPTRTWKVQLVDEQWNGDGGWCRVTVRLQNFTPAGT